MWTFYSYFEEMWYCYALFVILQEKGRKKLDLTYFHTARRLFCAARTRSAQPHRRSHNRGTKSPRQNTGVRPAPDLVRPVGRNFGKSSWNLNWADFKGPKRKSLKPESRALNGIFHSRKTPLDAWRLSLSIIHSFHCGFWRLGQEGKEEETWRTRVCNGSSDFPLFFYELFYILLFVLFYEHE